MSDDEDETFNESTPSQEDEWIIPEPCLSNNSLHWSEEGVFAIAARQTVYLVDPCVQGAAGMVGTVSLSNRDEKSMLCNYHVYDAANDSKLVDDLRFQNVATVSAIAWSPAGLGTQVRFY
jgi:hypothetical protein